MKTSTKILLGFLIMILLGILQMGVIHKYQSDIVDNIRQIKNIETPLTFLTEQVISYDAMLTGAVHVALLNAQKGDYEKVKEQKTKYEEIASLLDDLLKKNARMLLNQSVRSQASKNTINGYLKDLDRVNLLLVDREKRAFVAMEDGDIDLAYSLVVGGDYDGYKWALYSTCNDWTKIEAEIDLGIIDGIIGESQVIIYFNLIIEVTLFIIMIVILLAVYFLFAGREKVIIKKEKKLKVREKMEQKYRTLFENSVEAIFIADYKTRQLVDCNQAAEKLSGYSRAEILSMKADELHPRDKIKETMEKFQRHAEGKIKVVVTEVLTKNKKRIPVKVRALVVHIGNKVYSQGVFTEIN